MARIRADVVLVAHDVGGPGGMERVLGELVARAPDDLDLHVVSMTLAPELRERATWHRVRVPRRPFAVRYLAFALRAGLRLRRIDAGVRHVTGALVPNRADVSSIHFCHAGRRARTGRFLPAGLPPLRRANRALSTLLALWFERWSYRPGRLGVAAAVSTSVADEVRRHFPGVPVTLTPNGLDVEAFVPDPVARHRVRTDLAAGDDLVVLFVGGDWSRKGLWPLVDAVGELDGLRLWVAGPGPARRLERAARRAGCRNRVEVLGVRNDVAALMAAADVLAIPSDYETQPLVAWEAAACELPLIATPVGRMGALVDEHEVGVVVDPSDLGGDLHRALVWMLDHPEERRAMGRNGRRAVVGETWARSVAVTYALWEHGASSRRVEAPLSPAR